MSETHEAERARRRCGVAATPGDTSYEGVGLVCLACTGTGVWVDGDDEDDEDNCPKCDGAGQLPITDT